jgi:uncharacterized membrane-anchored protein YhcB (DUF1043 family)
MTAVAARVSKKKLTLAQAADQWERCKREMDHLKPQLEEAAAVLVDHFERTGRSTYKDRIALSRSTRLVLDQARVREFLGKQLADFQKRIDIRSLSLLK